MFVFESEHEVQRVLLVTCCEGNRIVSFGMELREKSVYIFEIQRGSCQVESQQGFTRVGEHRTLEPAVSGLHKQVIDADEAVLIGEVKTEAVDGEIRVGREDAQISQFNITAILRVPERQHCVDIPD